MHGMPRLFRALTLSFSLALAAPGAHAALPAAVDGRPLPSLAPMIERVTPAVVNINTRSRVAVRDPFGDDPFFRHFFGLPNAPRERIQQSLGSGVIVDAAKGYVLTNNHVIGSAEEIEVTLHDGRTLAATKVGADPDTDLALIKVPAERLTALKLGDSTRLRMGDFVVAVGNPFGIGLSASYGIVSAVGRTNLRTAGYQNFIQTDTAINPGNSGGALVDLNGELVGINSAIFSPSGGNIGIGFAIPSSLAADVMRQLLTYGEVKRGTLGVQTQDLDKDIAPLLGLAPGRGAVITRVISGSPAEKAGLKPGDVVTKLNGRAINNRHDLTNAEGLLPVGTNVTLEVVRDRAPITVSATLKAQTVRQASGANLDPRLAGATFGDLPESGGRRRAGVAVTRVEPNSAAAANGLQTGDVITAFNQRELADLATFEQVLAARPRQVLLTVVRGRSAFFLLVE